jgi:hypothetical protein
MAADPWVPKAYWKEDRCIIDASPAAVKDDHSRVVFTTDPAGPARAHAGGLPDGLNRERLGA